ncbi:hypothetical protein ACFE04_026913 [Oxalis oulophora]
MNTSSQIKIVVGAPPPPANTNSNSRLSDTQAHILAQTQYAQGQQPQTQLGQSNAQMANANNNNTAALSSPPVSAPGNARKSGHKPLSKHSGGSGSLNTLFKTMELAPATRRKKRKLPENQIPEKVAAAVPECSLYNQLLEYEAKIDSILARKKADIQESLKGGGPRSQKTLRIYVFNTFTNQEKNDGDTKDADPPSWSLKIIGRILEDGKDPILTGDIEKTRSSCPEFSSFLKKITIYLDPSLFPDNHVILWDGARSPVLHEGFEVKRKGNKEFTARIRIDMNYLPEKFKLSSSLMEFLGTEVETQSRVIAAIWHYVKTNKLQIPNEPSFFMCDGPLQKIFGEEKVKFSTVSQKITQHLSQPQAIHLEHQIKLSGNSPSGTLCYDVLVDVPFSLESEASNFLANTERQKGIDTFDDIIRASVKKIHEHCRRKAFFIGFCQSPGEFINELVTSQSKDLKLGSGEASQKAEKEHYSNFYNQSWAEDAVTRYLNRKSAGSQTPTST